MKRVLGFTLIEMTVLILVVSIIATYTALNYPGRESFDLDSISEQVKYDIRYTQLLAMGENTNYSITLSSGSYTISPSPSVGPATKTLPSGVTLSPQTITFDANGSPGAATTITITTTAGSRVLTLLAETGFVS